MRSLANVKHCTVFEVFHKLLRTYTHLSQLRSNWWRCYVRNSTSLEVRILRSTQKRMITVSSKYEADL